MSPFTWCFPDPQNIRVWLLREEKWISDGNQSSGTACHWWGDWGSERRHDLPKAHSQCASAVGSKTGTWAVYGEPHHHIKASRTPHILATLLYDVCSHPGTAYKLWSKQNGCEQGSSRRPKIWIAHSVFEALLVGVKTGPVSMKAVLVQIKFNYKYEKNPKWFKQDRCLFLSQIQSHLKVGNPGLLWMTTCQGHGLLLSCSLLGGASIPKITLRFKMAATTPAIATTTQLARKNRAYPLSEGVACTLTSHWPELSHMATSTCKEGWKM